MKKKIEKLTKLKNEAVKAQQYEKAIELRDKIKSLQNGK